MKSKKMLTMLIVLAVLIVVIIVFASVFSLSDTLVVCHDFQGGKVTGVSGAPTDNDIVELYKGKSILFLSKEKVTEELSAKYSEWHVIGIVKNFPNQLEVHFVKRVAVMKVDVGGHDVYLDNFGYVVDAPENGEEPLDVTSAFEKPSATTVCTKGSKLQFNYSADNTRLDVILETVMALWQCKCDIKNIPTLLGKENVFSFDSDGTMTVTMSSGAKIHFMEPTSILTQKFIDAFSVYCNNEKYDLQLDGTEITVWPDGKITTPDNELIQKV